MSVTVLCLVLTCLVGYVTIHGLVWTALVGSVTILGLVGTGLGWSVTVHGLVGTGMLVSFTGLVGFIMIFDWGQPAQVQSCYGKSK